MKGLLKILGLSVLLVNSLHAEVFKIRPYTLIKEDGEVLINFAVKSDLELVLERENPHEKFLFEDIIKKFKKETLHKVSLIKRECGQSLNVKIYTQKKEKLLYNGLLKGTPCLVEKDIGVFRFGFVSDTQEYKHRHEQISNVILQHAKNKDLQFILNGGDVVQTGDNENEWQEFFEVGSKYLEKIPLIAAIGNHDYRKNNNKDGIIPDLFKKYLRWSDVNELGNLAFDFHSFKLIVFNSNFFRLNRKQEKSQWKWLEEHLWSSKVLGQPVILATHYPIFSSSNNKFFSMSVRKLRKHLVPLVEKYDVKIVLSGHTHMYERSLKSGVNYIVAGPAGGRVNSPSGKNKYSQFLDYNSLTYTELEIINGWLTVKTYNQNNNMIDSLRVDLY